MRSLKFVVMIIVFALILMCSTNAYAVLLTLKINGQHSVEVGEKVKLQAIFNSGNESSNNNNDLEILDEEDNTNDDDVTDKAKWISSDESVATVDKNGVVTGVSEGHVVISAEYEVTSNFEIKVTKTAKENTSENNQTERPVITIGQTQEEAKPGDTYQNYAICYLVGGCLFILLVLIVILFKNLKKKSE